MKNKKDNCFICVKESVEVLMSESLENVAVWTMLLELRRRARSLPVRMYTLKTLIVHINTSGNHAFMHALNSALASVYLFSASQTTLYE